MALSADNETGSKCDRQKSDSSIFLQARRKVGRLDNKNSYVHYRIFGWVKLSCSLTYRQRHYAYQKGKQSFVEPIPARTALFSL